MNTHRIGKGGTEHGPAANSTVQLIKLLLFLFPSLLFSQPISIDCGSSSDQFFSPVPGLVTSVITPGATGDLTIRYGAFRYDIPTTPGLYDVTLYLRETGTVSGPGQRSFSVSINGQPVIVSFDLFADSGLNQTTRTFTASSSGFIGINFTYSLRSAIVSRIEVTPKPQSPAFPIQISETIPLADSIPPTQDILLFVLAKTPVPGSQLISILQSSRLGNDKVVARTVDEIRPKEVEFLLPTYRPFAGDVIQVLYWTLE